MNFLSNLIKASSKKNVLITAHEGADVDAFCSAQIIFALLKDKACKVVVGLPDHPNQMALSLAKKLKLNYQVKPVLSDFDVIIFVDLNSKEMLGSLASQLSDFKGKKFVIDHHSASSDSISGISLIDPDFVSTTELLFETALKEKIKLNPLIGILTSAGIITDSAGFLVADHSTFFVMAKALELSKKSFAEVNALFNVQEDVSEKIASLKGARRNEIYRYNNYLIATSYVSCFEASVARDLIRLGSDISFVASSNKKDLRISARANNVFINKTNFDLAKHVFKNIVAEFNGSFGGHAGAAGFNGTGLDKDEVLLRCVHFAVDFLKQKNPNAQLKNY